MWLERWWRSKGFGVHSPYAYRFITRVLCDDGVALYAYDAVDGVAAGVRERRCARRLCRILRDLDPAHVETRGSLSPALRCALDAYRPSSSGRGILVVSVNDDDTLTIDYSLGDSATPMLRFEDRGEKVSLAVPGLPSHSYNLNFR